MGVIFYKRENPNKSFIETFEYPNWQDTYDLNSYSVPAFSSSSLASETFEYPDWQGTYDLNSYSVPSFSGSSLITETFETDPW